MFPHWADGVGLGHLAICFLWATRSAVVAFTNFASRGETAHEEKQGDNTIERTFTAHRPCHKSGNGTCNQFGSHMGRKP